MHPSFSMIDKMISRLWKNLPQRVRRAFIRVTQQKFTASAAAVVRNKDDEILVLNHVLRPRSGWGLPGGFLERGEQPSEGIRREIREETGLEITEIKLLSISTLGTHIEFIFTANADGDPTALSREIFEWKWCDAAELPEGLPASQRFMIERAFAAEFDKIDAAV
jgi:ADP-ribose pyrophosphatase YjhB (NUDIX family)